MLDMHRDHLRQKLKEWNGEDKETIENIVWAFARDPELYAYFKMVVQDDIREHHRSMRET